MSLSYNLLWKKLIDLNMTKTDLRLQSNISTNVLAKMGRNEPVSLDNIERICRVLSCEISDVVSLDPPLPYPSECLNQSILDELHMINWDFPNESSDSLSGIHPYPAKFIGALPRELIRILGCKPGTIIFDPFCGSGTTLYEAQKMGFESVGVDLNPIACMISSVKTKPLHPLFKENYTRIINSVLSLIDSNEIPGQIEIPNIDHWFSKEVQRALYFFVKRINSITDIDLKEELSFCLSSIIVRVSNQESDTRYAAVEKNISSKDVVSFFKNSCERLILSKDSAVCVESKVICHDILTLDSSVFNKKVGLVITSPPYPNAYEYWLYHKYRMFWLGFDPINVRNLEIGARPHYQKKNGQTEDDFNQQMDLVFNLFDKIVDIDGYVCFVIGRSIIKKKYVDNADNLIKIATCHNFKLVDNLVRGISSNKKSFNPSFGKINTENIVIFQRI